MCPKLRVLVLAFILILVFGLGVAVLVLVLLFREDLDLDLAYTAILKVEDGEAEIIIFGDGGLPKSIRRSLR